MRFIHCALLGASLLWTSATSAAPLSGGESMKVPVFGAVTIYGGTSTPRSVVLFVSGDGGWNLGVTEMARRLHDDGALVVSVSEFHRPMDGRPGLDKAVASRLAAANVPVVGWSSLTYYWKPRSARGAATDLSRILRHYLDLWGVDQVLVVGYSFGADVAPFLVKRLPAALKAHVARVVLLAPSHNASFSFHFTDWLGGPAETGTPTTPEIARLTVPVVCIYPEDEPGSVYRSVSASPTSRAVAVGRGHHFSDEYDRLVATILSSTARSPAGHIQDERCSTGLLAR